MNIKKTLTKIKRKFRYLLLSETEKRMMALSVKITQEYINSREFRRTMQKCGFDEPIKQMLKEWRTKTTDTNQSY